ncbi:MAG: hypothetical protein EG823_07930 [Actinobacteria bacterium]|nr:hypothetical protein [Actinomycetota bacterium]
MSHRGKHPRRDSYYPPQLILTREACPSCGKSIYESRRAAESEVKRIDRGNRERGITHGKLATYECPHGNGWHVAHARSQGQRLGFVPAHAA